MINTDLFYVVMGIHPKNKPPKKAPRLIATPKATASIFLNEGYVIEFYSWDGKSRKVSWFWGPGEFVIPTSPYSNLVTSEDGSYTEMKYGNMISLLKQHDEARENYRRFRDLHNIAIAERIMEIKTKTPLEAYVNLITKKPWVLEKISKEDIASYLNVDLKTLEGFMNMKA